ncbi:MAG: cob(I)yrinic acid a,c-diamide adenosyltransferase [Desulfobacteraceae bacterium]|nr:MAG: cob(I)yrinic acid a,c-diamide adenosyltransferase [Desulfobacteraceae bacterium]
MKIYTGSGDRGKTSLFSGERVPKSHPRVEACGDVDELNSILGAVAAAAPKRNPELKIEIQQMQALLLQIGAWISTTPGSPGRADIVPISDRHIEFVEKAIDTMEEALPELRDFILPGGHPSAAWAHVARSVCRRLERRMVRLMSENESGGIADDDAESLVFINRLSDYLFELARFLNRLHRVQETPWKGQALPE